LVIDKITNNPPAQRSQLTSMSEILRSVQKLTVKTDSICLYPPIFTALFNHCHK